MIHNFTGSLLQCGRLSLVYDIWVLYVLRSVPLVMLCFLLLVLFFSLLLQIV